MALVSRKRGGGRKPKVLPNPFVKKDDWGDDFNQLWGTEDELDIRIEDILIGVCSSFSCGEKAEGETSQRNKIDWTKLLRIYRNVWELNTKSIQDYLQCSRTTSSRYCKAIELANPFIERLLTGKSGSNISGYIDVPKKQIKQGYLRIL